MDAHALPIQEISLDRISLVDNDYISQSHQDFVANEIAVALVYNGISHVVSMMSPIDLADFALGFSFSEGIINNKQEIYDIEIQTDPAGIILNIELSSQAFNRLKERRRNMTGRTSCGLCGLESLQQVNFPSQHNSSSQQVTVSAILSSLKQLDQYQLLRNKTGASHAATWVNLDGSINSLREDIGRHNALDKLIGHLLKQEINRENGFILLSSRASFEMIQKVATANIACIVAVSAPTALAIRQAQDNGITLVAFANQQRLPVYTHPHRISPI